MKNFLSNTTKGMILTVFLLTVLIANIGIVSANDVHSDEALIFPEWTYYAEIVEHSAMVIIAIIAILFLIRPYREHENAKQGILWLMIGLGIFALSQLLTNLHHFLIFPFGVLNAVVHHGLLLVSIVIITIALFKLLKGMKKW